LTHVQFVLLACVYWLTEQGQVPNQLAVAAQAGTDIKMTSQVLRRLEERGLVERRTDDRDTRAKALSVTQAGKALAIKAVERVETTDVAFFNEYPASFVAALKRTGH
jgi:DNA-binding MarR family transcriptional regulator